MKLYANVNANGNLTIETQKPSVEFELNDGESKCLYTLISTIGQYTEKEICPGERKKLDGALLMVRRYDSKPTLEEFKAVVAECHDLAKNIVGSDLDSRFKVIDEKPFDPLYVIVDTYLNVTKVTLKDGKIRSECGLFPPYGYIDRKYFD